MLKGLGFVAPFFSDIAAWKHLSDADLPYYSCCDADATARCYFKIRQMLEQTGRWPTFVRHCIRMSELFRLPQVGRITVDPERQKVLKARLEAERDESLAKLQTMVPEKIKRLKVLKTPPRKDAEQYTTRQRPCPHLDQTEEIQEEINATAHHQAD
jgi:hypothetical protein